MPTCNLTLSRKNALGETSKVYWTYPDKSSKDAVVPNPVTCKLFDPAGVQRDPADTSQLTAATFVPSFDLDGSVTGVTNAAYVDVDWHETAGGAGKWYIETTYTHENITLTKTVCFFVDEAGAGVGSGVSGTRAYGDEALIKQRCGLTFEDLGLVDDTEFTNLISSLNQRSTAEVEQYCQRDFAEHVAHTDKLDGNNRDRLMLPNYPVLVLSTVKVDGETLDTGEYRVQASPGQPDMNAGILERKKRVWPRDWENVEVTYNWGYINPPPDVKEVVEDLVVRTLLEAYRNRTTHGASSIGMDGFNVTFGVGFTTENPTSLDSTMKKKLEPHKRMVFA